MYRCLICKSPLDESETYEYRGKYACETHFDQVIEAVDRERQLVNEQEKRLSKGAISIELYDSLRKNPNILY